MMGSIAKVVTLLLAWSVFAEAEVVYLPKQIQQGLQIVTLLEPQSQDNYIVTPMAGSDTIAFRKTKAWMDESEHVARRGALFNGRDEGDGWVSFDIVPQTALVPAATLPTIVYLPKAIQEGQQITTLLQPQGKDSYMVTPAGGSDSIAFRRTKAWTDQSEHLAQRGTMFSGRDEGDGWVSFVVLPRAAPVSAAIPATDRELTVYLPKSIQEGLQIATLLQWQGQDSYMVSPTAGSDIIAFRKTKAWTDQSEHAAQRGSILRGQDEGDGWVSFRIVPPAAPAPAADPEQTVYLPASVQYGATTITLLQPHGPGSYMVTPAAGFDSIAFRRTKALMDESERVVPRGAILRGRDEGDGWISFRIEAPQPSAPMHHPAAVSSPPPGVFCSGERQTVFLPQTLQQGPNMPLIRVLEHLGQNSYIVTPLPGFEAIAFRRTKAWMDESERVAQRGAILSGQDEGDGWVSFRIATKSSCMDSVI